jgi:hypothetical protein
MAMAQALVRAAVILRYPAGLHRRRPAARWDHVPSRLRWAGPQGSLLAVFLATSGALRPGFHSAELVPAGHRHGLVDRGGCVWTYLQSARQGCPTLRSPTSSGPLATLPDPGALSRYHSLGVRLRTRQQIVAFVIYAACSPRSPAGCWRRCAATCPQAVGRKRSWVPTT